MDVIRLYDTVTGKYLGYLHASAWQWKTEISGAGALSATVPLVQENGHLDLRNDTAPWRTTIAITEGERVIHAGPIYKRKWSADSGELELEACGIFDLLKRRLVIPSHLANYNGAHTVGELFFWAVRLTGSLTDIMADLLELTMKWGPLPIVTPPREGGTNRRVYNGGDFASIHKRITELSKVQGGPEFTFRPLLEENGNQLRFHFLTGAPELIPATHLWDMRRSAAPVTDLQINEDAGHMAGDAWLRAGNQEDTVLIARAHRPWLEDRGWPLLQTTDLSHSTVTEPATLNAHALAVADMSVGGHEAFSFRARRYDEGGNPFGAALSAGDHVRLRMADPYVGEKTVALKVLELQGDEGEWIDVGAREAQNHAV